MPPQKKDKGKAPRKKSHSRKVPLILQTRTVDTEGGKKEVTIGQLIAMTVRAGAFRAEAARVAGISRTAIHNWANRGEDALAVAMEHLTDDCEQLTVDDVPEADRPYVDFVNALEEAEAQAEVWHVRNLKKHAEKDPKVSQWFLARRWPERWGPREHPDSSGGYTLADLERLADEAAVED